MNSSTTGTMPEEEVETLMQMVADEHGLKMNEEFKTAAGAQVDLSSGEAAAQPQAVAAGAGGGGGGSSGGGGTSVEDDLEERLRKLRSG